MPNYLMLLRKEEIDFSSYSPEDFQHLMGDFDAWNAQLEEKGLLASIGISSGAVSTLRKKSDTLITDGPYCETKDAIAGICVVTAADEAQAQALASACPFLPRGGSIEIRGIDQLELNRVVKTDENA